MKERDFVLYIAIGGLLLYELLSKKKEVSNEGLMKPPVSTPPIIYVPPVVDTRGSYVPGTSAVTSLVSSNGENKVEVKPPILETPKVPLTPVHTMESARIVQPIKPKVDTSSSVVSSVQPVNKPLVPPHPIEVVNPAKERKYVLSEKETSKILEEHPVVPVTPNPYVQWNVLNSRKKGLHIGYHNGVYNILVTKPYIFKFNGSANEVKELEFGKFEHSGSSVKVFTKSGLKYDIFKNNILRGS